MKYYIIAGEASGDLHASNLMKEIRNQDNEASFRVWGGDLMEAQGGIIVKHYKELAFMGFLTVLMNIKTIKNNFKICEKDIVEYNPDVIILVDYPGFNLRIAKYAKSKGFKIFYYISPKIWAWKQSRIKQIKKYVDKMFTIFPFETEFYAKHNYKVDYVGNPLLDSISNRENKNESFEEFIKRNNLENKPIISILAGSRKQEINRILPIMLEASNEFKDYQFIIAGAPSISKSMYNKYTKEHNVKLLYNETYNIVNHSIASLVTSGTATLETALINTPQVVCYKTSGGRLFYNIAKSFLKIRFISLVNIIMDKTVVVELIQHFMNKQNIVKEMNKILKDQDYYDNMLNQYKELREKLGGEGASKRAAEIIVKELH